jgi:NET1-associated nuclear protein 1 (U3 small nucleolar RNA-associated protein 17)
VRLPIHEHHDYLLIIWFGLIIHAAMTPNLIALICILFSASVGYASIYGALPSFAFTKQKSLDNVPFVPSERPWETIFSGSSHALPPLSKLCYSFLESLLEKQTV